MSIEQKNITVPTVDVSDIELAKQVESLVSQAADQMMLDHDDWTSHDLIHMSEKELEKKADLHDLEDDEPTRCFIKLIATSTNFASSNFIERIQLIPSLVQNIQDLLGKMKQEVKDYAEIKNSINVFLH